MHINPIGITQGYGVSGNNSPSCKAAKKTSVALAAVLAAAAGGKAISQKPAAPKNKLADDLRNNPIVNMFFNNQTLLVDNEWKSKLPDIIEGVSKNKKTYGDCFSQANAITICCILDEYVKDPSAHNNSGKRKIYFDRVDNIVHSKPRKN